jgi:hypothetical protein
MAYNKDIAQPTNAVLGFNLVGFLAILAGVIQMEFPWGNLVGGIIGVVAVVIGSRLTYARSSKEKIWDLRRAAYSVILSELAAIERICDDADEYIAERNFTEYFEH